MSPRRPGQGREAREAGAATTAQASLPPAQRPRSGPAGTGSYDEAIDLLRDEVHAAAARPAPPPPAAVPEPGPGPVEFDTSDEDQLLAEIRAQAGGHGATNAGRATGSATRATQAAAPVTGTAAGPAQRNAGPVRPIGAPRPLVLPRSGLGLPIGLRNAGLFYRQFAVMLKAGMSYTQALPLAGDVGGLFYRRRARRWAAGCAAGRPIWEQMLADGESPMRVALVRAGEATGRLPEILLRIAEHIDHLRELRNLVVQKSAYPLFLAHFALCLMPFLTWIIGKGSLQAVVATPIVVWGIILGTWAFLALTRWTGILAWVAMQIPLRFLARPFVEMNTCEVLAAALNAGFLPRDALDLAGLGCGNRITGDRLRAAGLAIEQGAIPDLTAAFATVGFSATIVNLIATGEKSGTLESTLLQAVTMTREQFRARTEWSMRVAMGALFLVAVLIAAITIIGMYQGYIGQVTAIADGI